MFQIESIIYNIMEYLEFPNDEIIVSRTKKKKISQNEPTYNDPSLKKINIFSKYSLVSKLWYKVEQKIRCKFCFGINQCIIINNKNIIKCVKCGHTNNKFKVKYEITCSKEMGSIPIYTIKCFEKIN